MNKMVANKAMRMLTEKCINTLCKECPIYDRCEQFRRIHHCTPHMYVENWLAKENEKR